MASRAETMEYQYLSVNNLNVHYRVSQGSSDKAILLFHPFLGSLHTWHAVMDPLRDATTRTVIGNSRR